MKDNKQEIVVKTSGGGISFVGLLTIVFIVLKLTHVIDWSWWWVLSPIWIGILLTLLIIIIVVSALIIGYAIVEILKKR